MGFLLTAALLCIVSGIAAQHSNQRQNLALRGRATQSSTYYNYNIGYLALAANSNDGNLDSNYYHGSCSLTGNDMSPWWRVDLLQPNKISQVVVTNRGDCCSDGLNGALILIGDSLNNNGNNNPSCAQITYIGNGATLTFECNGMVGRFVNIVRPGMAIVQLCEIQVYGEPLLGPICPTNNLIKIDNQKSR
uniref:Fucolectin tachylectin-4 pentraxin-1 domain-containing protein n=1 Tax=Xenopus tropicalis TaxID=8364 RepID=A0A1B8Y7Z0_XENTR